LREVVEAFVVLLVVLFEQVAGMHLSALSTTVVHCGSPESGLLVQYQTMSIKPNRFLLTNLYKFHPPRSLVGHE
jgi:hypothetical protein